MGQFGRKTMVRPEDLAFPPPHSGAKLVPHRLDSVLLEPGGISGLVLELKGLQLSSFNPVLTTNLPVADTCFQKLKVGRPWSHVT